MTTQSPIAPPETGRHPIRKITVFGVVDGDGKLFESHYVVGGDGRAEDEQDYAGVFLDRQAAHLLAGECGSDDNPLDVQPMILSLEQDTQAEPGTDSRRVHETFRVWIVYKNGEPEYGADGSGDEFKLTSVHLTEEGAWYSLDKSDWDKMPTPEIVPATISISRRKVWTDCRAETEPKHLPEPVDAWVAFSDGTISTCNHDDDDPSRHLFAFVCSEPRWGMKELIDGYDTDAANYEFVPATITFKDTPRYTPESPSPATETETDNVSEVTPDALPEPAREVSESADTLMQLLMNVKFVELLDKLPQAPEHVIEAYAVTDTDGQPTETSAYDEGPMLEVARKERTAWGVADEPQEVRRVIMLVMPKGSEVSENGGES